MKKISLILSMVLFTMLITSCETDNAVQENNEFQKSGAFNAETTYWSVLGNTESGMAQFDALTNEQKQAVWLFKYNRFVSDNTLSQSQLDAIDLAKDYVNTLDFSGEENEIQENSIRNEILNQFDSNTTDFLLLSLENGPGDISQSNNNQTEGCFWCRRYTITNPCHEEFVDGESIGFYQTVTVVTRRFWFRTRTQDNMLMPCDED